MTESPHHPGAYIRTFVIPTGVSVKAAAERLGVGRPALSNLLNGNAALSPEMAMRLERTFGGDSQALLEMQSAYERAQAQARAPEIAVRAHAPSVLAIRAMQITAWSETMAARTEFPALIRRLVASTASGLTEMDFPAFEQGQRPGWDGRSVTTAATAWVPSGAAGWEVGVSLDPAQKAESDYRQRTRTIGAAERSQMTLIFVTPRPWPGKLAWVEAKRAEGAWKGVRAYDCSDLEQWLEDSVPAQAWLGERLPLSAKDVDALETCWSRFAAVTQPPLSKALFRPVADEGADRLKDWLDRAPETPFTVVADSDGEALAALACAFETSPLAAAHAGDRVVVVRSAAALAKVASATSDLILVLASPEAEEALAGLQRRQHTIIVTRRNSVSDDPDLTVELMDDKTFRDGLLEMGFDHGEIDNLRGDSGGSRTVLRRLLAKAPAIQSPPWAVDPAIAERLIPLMLVGAWSAASEADLTVMTALAQVDAGRLERTVAELAAGADPPVWSAGSARGVVSKTDAFYAVRDRVTQADLSRFFEIARTVLSEVDPALDMPEEKRWMSQVFGKVRQHSGALRQGICETLVLLSVHGENLFRKRLGYDVKAEVDRLIRELLTPFNGATWQSQRNDLPRYAEAAPEAFMSLLKQDLASDDPQVFALMAPAGSGPWASPARSGLLWGLETLAWNPRWLVSVVDILGELSEFSPGDNWLNKPETSLESIFRSWCPQTAAPIAQRIAALRRLCVQHPTVGWRICMAQINPMDQVGHPSVRPRWRSDAAGAGGVATDEESREMALAALELALAWPAHDATTLGDLVQWLDHLGDFQGAVFDAIAAWTATGPSEGEKAKLRERLRQSTLTLRGRRGEPRAPAALRRQARAVYDALTPNDPVARHHWLFAKQWVDHSAEEQDDDNLDFEAREQQISEQRAAALREIWDSEGQEGLARLCAESEAPTMIGYILGAKVLSPSETDGLAATLAAVEAEGPQQSCLVGLLAGLPAARRAELLTSALHTYPQNPDLGAAAAERMLRLAPFNTESWDRAEALGEVGKRTYWANVAPPRWLIPEDGDVNRAVDELLSAERPRCAFRVAEMELKALTSENLLRLLHLVATCDKEPAGHYQLHQHRISDAFQVLTERSDVDPDRLVQLEFFYIDALTHTPHGIRNLERQLSESPELFFQAIAFAFRRRDGGEDPPELRAATAENASSFARSAYTLLHQAKRLPGTGSDGAVNPRVLRDWIQRVRALTRPHGRETIGDLQMGEMFGRSAPGADGIWPNEALREVLETHGTEDLKRGMMIGRFNARGVHWRGEGGRQERALSEQFSGWAAQVAAHYPFTAQLLDDMAASYARDAEREDTEALISRRLQT